MTETDVQRADWIAVDWGTSNARAWAMTGDGQVLAQATSDQGMSTLRPAEYEAALMQMIAPWLGQAPVAVVICGMAGSRQGWTEATYASVPTKPIGTAMARVATDDPRLDVHILPGLSQANPPDVMRGEETQIAGFLALNPGFDGVICLPGTHSKWVHVSAGEVVSFRTFMTGEMFALLSSHSVLRHSVGTGWDADTFASAVEDALSKPQMLAARLFAIRADGLLNGAEGDAARARLSGVLIGAELAAAKPYWLGQNVAVIGASGLSGLYAQSLHSQGVEVLRTDVDDMTLAGLRAAHAALKEHSA